MKINSHTVGKLLILAENINRYILEQDYKFTQKKYANKVYHSVTEMELLLFGDKDISDFDMYVDKVLVCNAYTAALSAQLIDDLLIKYDDFNRKMEQHFKIIARYTQKLVPIEVKYSELLKLNENIDEVIKDKFKAKDE